MIEKKYEEMGLVDQNRASILSIGIHTFSFILSVDFITIYGVNFATVNNPSGYCAVRTH